MKDLQFVASHLWNITLITALQKRVPVSCQFHCLIHFHVQGVFLSDFHNCSTQATVTFHIAKCLIFRQHDVVYEPAFFMCTSHRMTVAVASFIIVFLESFCSTFKALIFIFSDCESIHNSHPLVTKGKMHVLNMFILISLLGFPHRFLMLFFTSALL